jgi:hypothetical protein
LVTKEIGNNVQTVSHTVPSTTDEYLYNVILTVSPSLPSTWAPAPTKPTRSTT